MDYATLCRRPNERPEEFWAEQAKAIACSGAGSYIAVRDP